MRIYNLRLRGLIKYKMTIFSIILIIFLNLFMVNSQPIFDKFPNITNKAVVKVLIFNGEGVMDSSVKNLEESLNDINQQNLSSYYFDYSTSNVINSNTLSGYTILIMPGGNAYKYIKNKAINSSAIKQFVQDGNGYIGICAGAYAASNSVDGYYSAWSILNDVNTKNVVYEGSLSISITAFGSTVLNESEVINMPMENGPAIYSNSSQITMASYADNKTGYQNYAAIIGDTYGSGRVLLSGPHPELYYQDLQLLSHMVLWTSHKI